MAHTTKVPLGGQTLNQKWYLDINTGTYAVPVWTGVFGIASIVPAKEDATGDSSDFDGNYGGTTVTQHKFRIDLKLDRKVTVASATAYDTGQEALRAAGDEVGINNRVDVRWYEVTANGPIAEAYRGFASVTWSEDGGDSAGESTVSCSLLGQGDRTAITHPDYAAAVPTITGLSPETGAAAGGEHVYIYGTGFTGTVASGVEFDSTDAEFTVLNDNTILATTPAHAAGAAEVTVENATGVSTVTKNFVYTA